MSFALLGAAVEVRAAALWVTCASLLGFVRGQMHPFPSLFTITSGLRRRWNCTGYWLLESGHCSCTKAESRIALHLNCHSAVVEPLLIAVAEALGLPSRVLAKSNHILVHCKAKKKSDTTNQWCHPNQNPQVVTHFPVPSTTRDRSQCFWQKLLCWMHEMRQRKPMHICTVFALFLLQ